MCETNKKQQQQQQKTKDEDFNVHNKVTSGRQMQLICKQLQIRIKLNTFLFILSKTEQLYIKDNNYQVAYILFISLLYIYSMLYCLYMLFSSYRTMYLVHTPNLFVYMVKWKELLENYIDNKKHTHLFEKKYFYFCFMNWIPRWGFYPE